MDDPKSKEAILRLQELEKTWIELIQRMQEAIQPYIDAIERYTQKDLETQKKLEKNAERIEKTIIAIHKMEEAQFVYWDTIPASLVEELNTSDKTNVVLRKFLIKDKFRKVYSTIEMTNKADTLKKHRRLYMECVQAFQNGNSDLAVTGFTSIFDGLLAEISKNPTHKLQPRFDIIKEKLEKEEVIDNDEYAMLTLGLTFEKTLESYGRPAPFTEKEPHGLNRHWIAHGRSTRKKTKLDCVKMINLIYSLLLINQLDTQEKGVTNE